VAKMNALAASLGAVHTHYADASGYNPQSVSTAADTLRIAGAGMRIPTFAQVVGLSTVSLPLVGTVHNIVTEIGSNGVIGVKSGYTSQAGGCMVLAGIRVIGGRSVLVLASALAQHVPAPVAPTPTTTAAPGAHPTPPATAAAPTTTTSTIPTNAAELEYPLRYAGPIVEALLDASKAAVVQVPLVTRGQLLVSATAEWNGTAHEVGAVAARGAWLVGWPGQKVASVVRFGAVPPGAKAGSHAGNALYALGPQIESVPLTITHTLQEPSWWWRLVHG
jgi:serine-type D-Ala-D-Ala carboxypeptidase (penicillin-binding protein 5/6)